MSRFIKILLFLIIIVPVLVISAALFLLSNPEYYRDRIETTVADASGFELAINGEINWRYWPPIALEIHDVEVTPPAKDQALASFTSAAIDLALLPLLFGGNEISIDGISLDGLAVDAVVDGNGNPNWVVDTDTTTPATQDTTAEEAGGKSFDIDIGGTQITNTTINYRDHSAGLDYTVAIPRIETGPVRFNQPTRFDLGLNVIDKNTGLEVDFDANGNITFDARFSHIAFAKLMLNQSVRIPDMPQFDVSLQLDGAFDTEASKLESRIAGTFSTPKATPTKIDGTLNANVADKPSAVFDLTLDAIKVDPYLGTSESPQPAPSDAPPADVEVLPLEALDAFEVDGVMRIGKIQYDVYEFTDFVADIDNADKELTADVGMNGYSGAINLVFTGSTGGGGAGHTNLNVTGIDITQLTEFETLTGSLNLDSNTTFTGSMLSDVMSTLDGTSNFNVKDGTLDVRTVKKIAVVVDGLRGKNSGIGQWPDRMPFANMEGQHRFVNGTKTGQTFGFALENMTVDGTGGFDYFANTLDYEVKMELKETSKGEFRVAPGLAGIEWPLHCKGALNASPADLCLADTKAMQQLIANVAKEAVERKGKELAKEKAREELGVESTEELEDKAKKEVEDKAKEKAGELFKGLFKRDD